MSNHQEFSSTGYKTIYEARAKITNWIVSILQALMGSSWFVALGKMIPKVTDFFKQNMNYFFAAGLVLSLVNWVVSTVEFATAGNKNLGKTANYLLTTFNLLFYFATGCAFVFIAATVGMPMLIASMFVNSAVDLARAIYFAIQFGLEQDAVQKAYYKERALNHGLFCLLGGVASAAFVVLMLVPAIPLVFTIAIGVVGIVIIMSPHLITLFSWVKSKLIKSSEPAVSLQTKDEELNAKMPFIEPANVSHEQKKGKINNHYYKHVQTIKPESWSKLLEDISAHIRKIETDCSSKQWLELFWPQQIKRQNKITALNFLKSVIQAHIDRPIPASANEANPWVVTFQEKNYAFDYKDKNELTQKISRHINSEFPGVNQSYNMLIGDTADCFNQAFLGIIKGGVKLESEPRKNHAL